MCELLSPLCHPNKVILFAIKIEFKADYKINLQYSPLDYRGNYNQISNFDVYFTNFD